MAFLRNKRRLAAVSRETPKSTRNSRAQNVPDPELTQDYISHVSEEIEGRVTRKLSKEFSRTESRILGALSKIDEFFLNPQVRTRFVAVPGTSRNGHSENRETTGDPSSKDHCPEVRFSSHKLGHLNNPKVEEYSHMVTGVTGEIRHYPHMVTGITEEVRQYPHMTTGIKEETPYCSPSSSLGKQKEARSTGQPQFRSENTPETIEADQILLALRHLAMNSNSANFNNNSNRISKLPESLMTTRPIFDGKSEKFELFEALFQTSLKTHNQLPEEDKFYYFHTLMRGDAQKTFKNISSRNRESLAEVLTVKF